jgi:hypothetical protein
MPPPPIGKLNLGALPKRDDETKEVAPARPNLGFSLDKMNAVQNIH